jgi:D-sedoheptulose 7-phosphate isomerase
MIEVSAMRDTIVGHLKRSAEIKLQAADACAEDIERAAVLIATSFNAGGKLMICGNGGSAADAQHMAAELVSRLTLDFDRPGLPAMALTTDSSILTAYANDFEFEGVFARQVQALGRSGDVLLGISTSGSSRNIIRAAEQARAQGISIVTLTAERGQLRELATVAIRVPAASTAHVQEAHLAIEHVLCHIVERAMFATPSR